MQIVILVGHLGGDPETRYTNNGNPVCNLSIATTKRWTDKNSGEAREKTEWHRVVLFGRQAEVAGQYLAKGSQVLIKGELQTRKWQADDGSDRYSTEIIGNEMKMLSSSGKSGGGQQQQPTRQAASTQQQTSAPASSPAPAPATAGASEFDEDFSDDIPF